MKVAILKAGMMCSALAMIPGIAYAQDATDEGGLREIVVTARKTSENLQTTPVAVTALDQQALADRQVTSVADLQQVTPGLTALGGGPGPTSIVFLAIRGNVNNGANSVTDSAVGVYVDGVYYARPIVSNLGLLDMGGAEVLRGTQGTLFGRNTTGGAMNLSTIQPGGDFSGYVKAGIGNYSQRVIEGAVTTPLAGDQVSARIAGRYSKHDGYGNNPITGQDIGKLDSDIALRGTLKIAPDSAPVKLTISGDYVRSRDGGQLTGLKAVNPAGLFGFLYAGQNPGQYLQTKSNFFTSYGNPNITGMTGVPQYLLDDVNKSFSRNEAWGIRGTLEYEIGDMNFKSITAFRKSNTANSEDLDGTPSQGIAFASYYKQEQFSEEVQLSGKTDKLDWIVGAMYFKENGTEESDSWSLLNVTAPAGSLVPPPGIYVPGVGTFFATGWPLVSTTGNLSASGRNFGEFSSQSIGVFGQVNYHVTDKLRVTAGARYTWDRRFLVRHLFNNIESVAETLITPPPSNVVQPFTCLSGPNAGQANSAATCSDPNLAKFKYPAWLLGLDYELNDDMFVYAKTGGAALSGGFNTRQVPAGLVTFSPEKVKDVELGFKGDFLDKHLRVNLASFYMWRNGAQNVLSDFVGGRSTQYVTNQGNIRAYGFEAEATVIPWQGMEITGGVSNLHSKFAAGSFIDEGSYTALNDPNDATDDVTYTGPIDRSGEKVPRAPKWTANIGATQNINVGFGQVSLHADYAWTDDVVFAQTTPYIDSHMSAGEVAAKLANQAALNAAATQKAYGLINARAAITFDNPGIELAVWGRNIGNTKYNSYIAEFYNSLGFTTGFQGNPETYGVTATFKW